MKKRDGDTLCAKSSFNRFFIYCLRNSKFKPFLTYLPLGSRTSIVSRKNAMVMNFAERAKSSFDRFFVHHLGNSKYWPFPTY
ncbi:hypothetical protein GW17_00059394 [Ensete ventricosum]|nr:hypothetical protein GW17_00059394 [Ensete ventricosum]